MAVASAIMVTAMGVHAPSVEAKSLRLSSKRVTLTVGKSKTIKVRGAKKVTWKVAWGSKCIRLSNKKKTSVKITAKKSGSAKIQAKAGKKKLSCRVTVSPKTTVLKMNVNKVDKATVKKVHETLSKGNTLRVRIQGGNRSQRVNTMDNLIDAVGKYNEYGVLPQVSSSTKKYYTEWKADKELAGQYKWGLLLVKDIVSSHKNDYPETLKLAKEGIAYKESTLKEKYKYEGEEWKKIFEEVTGITYTKRYDYSNPNNDMVVECYYTDGQTAKPQKIKTDCSGYNWLADKDYYYTTIKYNGTEYTVTEPIQLKINAADDISDDDEWNRIISDKNNYFCKTEIDGVKVEIPVSDITFHYEPLKVDLNAVNTVINTKYETDLNAYKSSKSRYIGSAGERLDKLLHDNKLCDLSSAVQQYWVQQIIKDYDYMDYEAELGAKGGSGDRSPVNPAGRIHGEGGAKGLKLAYQRKWMGVCGDYADLEMTLYRLFGVEAEKIACHKCNHGWTVVKLTNSDGAVGYVLNDYGLKATVYNKMPDGCPQHDRSNYKDIQHINFKYN